MSGLPHGPRRRNITMKILDHKSDRSWRYDVAMHYIRRDCGYSGLVQFMCDANPIQIEELEKIICLP